MPRVRYGLSSEESSVCFDRVVSESTDHMRRIRHLESENCYKARLAVRNIPKRGEYDYHAWMRFVVLKERPDGVIDVYGENSRDVVNGHSVGWYAWLRFFSYSSNRFAWGGYIIDNTEADKGRVDLYKDGIIAWDDILPPKQELIK